MPSVRLLLLPPLLLVAVLLPGSGRAADPIVLKGTVGPGYTISIKDSSGRPVTRVLPGSYTLQVQDLSDLHNFHLSGPGVNMRTEVETTGTQTWSLTLVDGTYGYKCDAHPSQIHGVLNVGAAPPPTPKLNGRVGPKKTISLKTAAGATVKKLKAGAYKIAVKDATRADNFHLLGPGVNKKTGVAFRGSVSWKVRFKAGKKYTVRSDAHKRLTRTFRAG